jgi:hypothetical protein
MNSTIFAYRIVSGLGVFDVSSFEVDSVEVDSFDRNTIDRNTIDGNTVDRNVFDKNVFGVDSFERKSFNKMTFDVCDIAKMYNHLPKKTDEKFKNLIDDKYYIQCPDFDEYDEDSYV